MKILIYRLTHPSNVAPPVLSYIYVDGAFLPVRFSGANEEEATAKAQDHWDAAMEKARNRKSRGKAPAQMPAPAAADDDTEEAV